MGVRVEALSLSAARLAAVEAVCQLNRDVGIPGHLREVGVRKEDIPALAQAALADVCTGGTRARRAWPISSGYIRRPGEGPARPKQRCRRAGAALG